jgi:hypothetical protein
MFFYAPSIFVQPLKETIRFPHCNKPPLFR